MPSNEDFRAIGNEHQMFPAVLYRGPTTQPAAVMVECFDEGNGQVRLTMRNIVEPFEIQLVIDHVTLQDLVRSPKPRAD